MRDVVVILRSGALPPRVLGLAVEVQPRRRVFIPIGQVTSVDSDAVIVRGRINLRRFERRTGETLAITELLDRKVVLVESGQQVTVADVAIEQTRTRDWYITRVAVRSGGGFRRRGQLQTVDWDAVTGLAQPEEEQGAANLLAAFDQLRPPDLAHVLHRALAESVAPRWSPRSTTSGSPTSSRSCPRTTRSRSSPRSRASGPPTSSRRWHRTTPPTCSASCRPEEAERLLGADGAGRGRPGTPAAQLLRQHRRRHDDQRAGDPARPTPRSPRRWPGSATPSSRPRSPRRSTSCRPPTETPTGKYLGIAHIQRLLREPPSALVSGIVDTGQIDPLPPDCPLPEVTAHLATYNLVAVPVVDDADHLLGAVTVDDVLDHLLPEDWRDRPTGDVGVGPVAREQRRRSRGRGSTSRRTSVAASRCRATTRSRWGRISERIARFLGTWRFIGYMIAVHRAVDPLQHRRAERPALRPYGNKFTLLTLLLSLQASYAAPLILLAQNRQADRDRVQFDAGPGAVRARRRRHRVPGPRDRRGPASRSARSPPVTSCAASCSGCSTSSTPTARPGTTPPDRLTDVRWRHHDPVAPPSVEAITAALATVKDPEIHRPITDLGMVDEVAVADDGVVLVKILLTTAGCPLRTGSPPTSPTAVTKLSRE